MAVIPPLKVHELEARLAPAAALVFDAVTQPAGSGIRDTASFQGQTYFFANDRHHGLELWRTDGSSSGTLLLRDINVGMAGSSPRSAAGSPGPYFTEMNGLLYFAAQDGVNGRNLWRTDGTSTGTSIVFTNAQLDAGPVRYITNVGGQLYFQASNAATGYELYISDGTATGTRLVKDIRPGTNGSFTDKRSRYTNLGSRLAFFANDGNGEALWSSDGTSSGTTRISTVQPTIFPTVVAEPDQARTAVLNGVMYFAGNDTATGAELWRTDGTSSGTWLVSDINTSGHSNPRSLTVRGDRVYFFANINELWTSDGTSSGTLLVRSMPNGVVPVGPTDLTRVGDALFFIATNNTAESLWVSDGTSAGTVLVKTLPSGSSGDRMLTNSQGKLFFYARSGVFDDGLWSSDGTSAGTSQIIDIAPGNRVSDIMQLIATPTGVIFRATTDDIADELWKSDGTSSGTQVVKDIQPGNLSSYSTFHVNANGTLFYSGFDFTHGRELWASDGTSTGTRYVKDINTFAGAQSSSTPDSLMNVGSRLYFFAYPSGTGLSNQLWSSDGTSSGTNLVRPIATGSVGTFMHGSLRDINDRLYLAAYDSTNYGIWTSDGTSSGTVMVNAAGTFKALPKDLTNVNGIIYFAGSNGTFPGSTKQGEELWRSDGTSSGTFIVRDISPQSSPTSDNPSSSPGSLININGTLFFHATQSGSGRELWKSDGTSSGTILVRDIRPGSSGAFSLAGASYRDPEFTPLGNNLFFVANDGVTGNELWMSDGTSSGTVRVADINTTGSSEPTGLTVFQGRLYFTASDAEGFELWSSDGTSSGTVKVRDIAPGAGSSFPLDLTAVNQHLYFTADDGTHGRELWVTDGTAAGTVMTADLRGGPLSSRPSYLREVNGTLFFTADPGDTGVELWKMPDLTLPRIAKITSPNSNGVYTTGEILDISLTFDEPVTLAGGNLTLSLDSGAVINIAPFTGISTTASYTVQAGQTSPDLTVTAITLPNGATLRDRSGNDALLTPIVNLDQSSNLIINPPPPTTVNATVNLAVPQRSRLTSIELTFSNPVNATTLAMPGAVTFTRTAPLSSPTIDVASGLVLSATSGFVTSLTLTFANLSLPGIDHGSLADGRWQLNIPSLNYASPLNAIHRLFGDIDGNGTVDATDFGFFPVFGTINNSAFDFNNNGDIDSGTDLSEFGNRFGLTL